MDESQQIQEIKQIKIKDLKVGRTPSVRINNFYSLMTIVIMSVVVIWYVNYILPEQEKAKKKALQEEAYRAKIEKQHQLREAQIQLSQKLNKPKEEIKK